MTLETRIGGAPALQRAVLEAIAYSDVFDYPLTPEEIRHALHLAASPGEVGDAIAAALQTGHVVEHDGFLLLKGRQGLVAVRRHRARESARLMQAAAGYGAFIARLPFVRMVGLTGSLAVDNAVEGDDIDYLIVTAPGRLWLARALTVAVVHFARLRGLTLCPNYLLSENALTLTERDAYTARELLQMRVLAGHDTYGSMLGQNAWCRAMLPNWPAPHGAKTETRFRLTRLAERLLSGRLGDAVERWLLHRKGGALRARAEASQAGEVLFSEDVCKGHFEAHGACLRQELSKRLRDMAVEP